MPASLSVILGGTPLLRRRPRLCRLGIGEAFNYCALQRLGYLAKPLLYHIERWWIVATVTNNPMYHRRSEQIVSISFTDHTWIWIFFFAASSRRSMI